MSPPVLVFNTSPLSSFARAGRLDVLARLTSGHSQVTVRAVIDELQGGYGAHPSLQDVERATWLEVVPVDALEELRKFAEYHRQLGSGPRNVGEASVLAWAESHGAIAVLDDQTAVQLGRARGVTVYRTLRLIAEGLKTGVLSPKSSIELVDSLERAGARFPITSVEFLQWAQDRGLT